MSIKTVGGAQDMLAQYSSLDWGKAASLRENSNSLTLNDAPGAAGPKGLGGMLPLPSGPMEAGIDSEKIEKSFGQFLAESVSQTNELQKEANVAIEKLVSGQSNNIQDTLIKVEQADTAFKMMNQIRMKVLDAYKEMMRMQI